MGRLSADLAGGVLASEAIRLGQRASDKLDALRQSGRVLLDLGAVEPAYVDAMLEREELVSTFMGEGVAIPHGTNESKESVHRTALGFLQFPDGVDWDGRDCHVCIAIASKSDEHIGILQALAKVLSNQQSARRLRETRSVDEVLELLAP